MADTALHPSVVALVALAANIAANHPKQGLCQLERLRGYGVSEAQIREVVEIARHIRDEAGEMLDADLDAALGDQARTLIAAAPTACCTSTPGGRACC